MLDDLPVAARHHKGVYSISPRSVRALTPVFAGFCRLRPYVFAGYAGTGTLIEEQSPGCAATPHAGILYEGARERALSLGGLLAPSCCCPRIQAQTLLP